MTDTNDLIAIVRINEDIKSVVRLASRINMLALNAILLSRKAGAVALGFGVISDELRFFSKTLTQNMHNLMQLSYSSIQTVSLYQRHMRMSQLMALASQQIDEPAYKNSIRVSLERDLLLRNNTSKTYECLQQLLHDADDTSRFGSVIARALKIEATYGGSFSAMLMQIAMEFGLFIDAIPEIINRLNNSVRRKNEKSANHFSAR